MTNIDKAAIIVIVIIICRVLLTFRCDLCRLGEVGCGAFEDLGSLSTNHHLSP